MIALLVLGVSAAFIERFETLDKWIPSTATKEGVDADLAKYNGKWRLDDGLVLDSVAAHSAISTVFAPVDPKDNDLVVQYMVNPTKGLDCGGAYLKIFSHKPAFKPEQMTDKTPYTIMFGPDKCGGSDKVHFIFRHQNPVSKQVEEKHLAATPPSQLAAGQTNLYTLAVFRNQTFEILINNNSVKTGSLLEAFEPPVNPEKEVDDASDVKPADWVDQEEIPDESAEKPEDWNEDAPREIPDKETVKPEGWADNEPLEIADPEVTKPEDWDDEEDGDWVAPVIRNPACSVGCGPWKRPMKRNPEFKGKWIRPKIANPEYKGKWAPRKIPNVNYFEDKTPANFSPLGAIGFELWTMSDGIKFGSIYVGHSLKEAKELADELWAPISKLEAVVAAKKMEEQAKAITSTWQDYLMTIVKQIVKQLDIFLIDVQEFIESVQLDPLEAIKEMPHVVITLLSLLALPTLFIGWMLSPSPKPRTANAAKSDKKAEKADKATKESVKAEKVKDSPSKAKKASAKAE